MSREYRDAFCRTFFSLLPPFLRSVVGFGGSRSNLVRGEGCLFR